MIKIIVFIFMISTAVAVYAEDDPDLILERDKWQPDKKFNVIDPDNNQKTGEYIKKDPWDNDKWNMYDKDGDKKGTIERNKWNPNRFNFRKEKD